MAVAFTDEEQQEIVAKMKEAAHRIMCVVGMRQTTVDQLVEAAGISKGAFYKFYSSKEMLFLDLLEDLHTQVYQQAAVVLERNIDLAPSERASEAVMEICRTLEQSEMVDFVETDVPYLLKKIPSEARETHYHSDGVHIKRMFTDAGLKPVCSLDMATATVRGIMLTVSHRKEIGELYPQVLETMVYGICARIFGN